MTDVQDVVVVGGGVVGLAVARDLARDHEVTLLERDTIAGGATGRAAGLVSIAADYGAFPAVADHALDAFERFDGSYGFHYRECTALERPSSERGSFDAAVARLRDKGFDVDHVSATAARETCPRLVVPEEGFLRFNRGGWVVPEEFAGALARGAADRGADLRTGVAVNDIVVTGVDDSAEVAGVETDAGRVDADAVILAAGWRTADLLASTVSLPVRPYRTQCVVLAAEADLGSVPMGWSPSHNLYWRPTRDDHLLVGGGSHLTDDPAGSSRDVSSSFRRRVARLSPELFEIPSPRYVEGWAGVDGATPDAYPIVDAPTAAPGGLVVATGMHGRGVMAAFPAASLVRGHIAGGTPLPRTTFTLDRFDSLDRDFEFVRVSG